MWIDRTWLKNINPINKVLSSILMVAVILLTRKVWFSCLLILCFYLLAKERCEKDGCLIALFFSVIAIFYPPFLWISKIILVGIYLVIVCQGFDFEQVKYLLEKCLPNNSLLLDYFTNWMYERRLVKVNYLQLEEIRKSYGLDNTKEIQKQMKQKAKERAKIEIDEVKTLKKLRFYGVYPTKTYIHPWTFEVWDRNYLFGHLLLLIFTVVLGR